ncbi:hypothetical protein RFI_10395 [Reticulomyxa filosa]|uniref:Uncharacterized protein n=1 Tax=Reticulomyxa filosa TaxID=46433 RepID=X6NLE8_RETFI|nr:hypothetical protein RFI_10395 [Reticulomyxa filosa]|eukprot:ETO26738.1 hypothetical protein RFI_10395 [Reticulomyxa filosa]
MIYFRGEIRWATRILVLITIVTGGLELFFGPKRDFIKDVCVTWVRFSMLMALLFVLSRWVLHKLQQKSEFLEKHAKELPTSSQNLLCQCRCKCPCSSLPVIPTADNRTSPPTTLELHDNRLKRQGTFQITVSKTPRLHSLFPFEKVMRDEDGIELFMKHLNKEFCMGEFPISHTQKKRKKKKGLHCSEKK